MASINTFPSSEFLLFAHVRRPGSTTGLTPFLILMFQLGGLWDSLKYHKLEINCVCVEALPEFLGEVYFALT